SCAADPTEGASPARLGLVTVGRSVDERRWRDTLTVTVTVPPLATALERCDQMAGGLSMSALAVPVALLLRDVLQLADHPIDLVIGHAPDQRGSEDACDVYVVSGFHGRRIALAPPEHARSILQTDERTIRQGHAAVTRRSERPNRQETARRSGSRR